MGSVPNKASQETGIYGKPPFLTHFTLRDLTEKRMPPLFFSKTTSCLVWHFYWLGMNGTALKWLQLPKRGRCISFKPILEGQRKGCAIPTPPIIKSYCRIPEFSTGDLLLRSKLHCFSSGFSHHADAIIPAPCFSHIKWRWSPVFWSSQKPSHHERPEQVIGTAISCRITLDFRCDATI